MKKALSRRQFLERTILGAGAAATAPIWAPALAGAAADPLAITAKSAVDRVKLGRTDVKPSFLAIGTGVQGGNQSSAITRMGQEAFTRIMHEAVDKGINFMDLADLYGSHPFARKALAEIPRDKYIVLSKVWPRPNSWNQPEGPGATGKVERFCKELGVDYLDICLLHCMTDDKWPAELERMRDDLSELKEKGTVRAVGCSCHDLGALKVASEHPWVDVIFSRINNKGLIMDGKPDEVAPVLINARKNGKAVVGMKIFGEGRLVKPEEMDASLDYVLGNKLVSAMTIGMLATKEVDENVERITRHLKAA